MGIQSCGNTKRRYVRHAECATRRGDTHLSAGIERIRTRASTSLLRVSAGVLCLASNGDWCSRSLKILEVGKLEDQTGLGWELLY